MNRVAVVAAVMLATLLPYRGTASAATTNHLSGGDWSVVTSTRWTSVCVKWEGGSPGEGGDLGCPDMRGYHAHNGGRVVSHRFAPRWSVAEVMAGSVPRIECAKVQPGGEGGGIYCYPARTFGFHGASRTDYRVRRAGWKVTSLRIIGERSLICPRWQGHSSVAMGCVVQRRALLGGPSFVREIGVASGWSVTVWDVPGNGRISCVKWQGAWTEVVADRVGIGCVAGDASGRFRRRVEVRDGSYALVRVLDSHLRTFLLCVRWDSRNRGGMSCRRDA